MNLFLGGISGNKQLKSKLFTASGTFPVPADVFAMWVDGVGGGGGGGGGDSTPGGGGGGGASGMPFYQIFLPVTPGESLTIVVGAAGLGGAANNDGGQAGITGIQREDSSYLIRTPIAASGGTKGLPSSGGNGGSYPASATQYYPSIFNAVLGSPFSNGYSGGTIGAAFSNANTFGSSIFGNMAVIRPYGTALGGGGGPGGSNQFGYAANGGSNGGPGPDGIGYGAGGGGGSGNSAGGNGSPGFIRLYMIG